MRKLAIGALLALSGAFVNLGAYEVSEWKLEKKVAKADLVFVGTVERIRKDDSESASTRGGYATIAINANLKGNSTNSLELRFGSNVAELTPDCCSVGSSYVFFLSRKKDGILRPVNPPFGIVRIQRFGGMGVGPKVESN